METDQPESCYIITVFHTSLSMKFTLTDKTISDI